MKKLLALSLAVVMLLGMVSVVSAQEKTTPFVIATSELTEKFSPFFATTVYDRRVADMTQASLMTTDRVGAIVFNGIKGETIPYNGKDYEYHGIADISVNYDEKADKTVYTAKLKEGVKFADGVEMTADDIIFNYYVYLDPSYDGSTTLRSYPIVGLNDYLTQTTSEVFEKYNAMVGEIAAKGKDYKVVEGDTFTQEQYDDFWANIETSWTTATEDLVELVNGKYAGYIDKEALGIETVEEAHKVAATAATWGFAKVEDGKLTLDTTNAEFDLKAGAFPTLADLIENVKAKYNNNLAEYTKAELEGKDYEETVKSAFISTWGPKDEQMGVKGVPNVTGIKKTGKYSVEVTLDGFSAPAIYSVLGIQIAPLHYYGDKAEFDYDNNKFGHPYGNLDVVKSKTQYPMGAGPYKFLKYENRVVYFEANENYIDGQPKTKEVQLKETQPSQVISGIETGAIDQGEVAGKKLTLEEVASKNSNGELNGDKFTIHLVDNLGYAYIGLNADTINVGGKENKGSAESKAFRKALATVFAYHRDIAVESYYGDAASVIEYPISNTSWAAPQKTDADYRRAFTLDPEGKEIYTEGMSFEDGEAAAIKASLAWFEAAGFTVEDGKVTAAPEGAKLSYEIIIPANGTGDHPAYGIATAARETFAKMGFEIKINDPADSGILWTTLDAGTQELWAAAWGAVIDPDMYQIYYSGNIAGLPGATGSNHYRIADPNLDELIMEARKSDNQSYRKTVYKAALDTILDWAVELPIYQRKNGEGFSSERINVDTLITDPTTFYEFRMGIDLIEMR